MNNNLYLREELIRKAIEAFKKSFDVTANRLDIGSDYDVIEMIFTFNENVYRKIFEVETNKSARSVVGQLALKQKQSPKKMLLIADFVSPAIADLLREQEISFLDTSGNAFFNEPEFYIFISSRQKEAGVIIPKPHLIFRARGLGLLFVLLSIPNAENKTYRELAELSGVSLGTVSEIMTNLTREFYLIDQSHKKLLVRKDELLKRWIQGYAETLRPRLFLGRFQSPSSQWWRSINFRGQSCWGSETAASLMTNYLEPVQTTIYTEILPIELQLQLQLVHRVELKDNPKGNLEVLKKFWNFDNENPIAPPLLVYADLVATADARNLEVAQMIYDQHLAQLVQ